MTAVVIVSTGRNAPTKDLCIASVKMQLGGPYQHVYVESPANRTPLQNWYEVIHQIQPEAIVCLLEGDDWLFSSDSILKVRQLYLSNPEALLTYGQFVTDKCQPGFSSQYTTTDYRSAPWLATHLKTFKAGLFHKIKQEDLMHNESTPGPLPIGQEVHTQWIPMASDQAIMLPMLEMAGPQRQVFNREPLIVYNTSNSHASTTDDAGRKEEQRWAQVIRAKRRYERLP